MTEQLSALGKTMGEDGTALKVRLQRSCSTAARQRVLHRAHARAAVAQLAVRRAMLRCPRAHHPARTCRWRPCLLNAPSLLLRAAPVQALLDKALAERSYVEVGGKPDPSFKYMNAADAAAILAQRRKQVRCRHAARCCAAQGRCRRRPAARRVRASMR